MTPVQRSELVDYVTWSEQRPSVLSRIFEVKSRRRIHLGPALTFLFENRDTVRYQVQEMMRLERLVKEADIVHELATYNELLGGPGELGCTLLVEIESPEERAHKLRAWADLPEHLYVLLDGGRKVRAKFDPRQREEGKLSSVQFARFPVEGRVPVAIGSDLPELMLEVRLTGDQSEALREDLAGEVTAAA
jgi:hypothetical protein